jgi:hypothetical protein
MQGDLRATRALVVGGALRRAVEAVVGALA